MERSEVNLFDLFLSNHTVTIPWLPITDVVRLDVPTVYSIHDNGLTGTGECLYVGQTGQPFERLYNQFTKRTGTSVRAKAEGDSDVDTESAIDDGEYIYENVSIRIVTCDSQEEKNRLERAAIGRLAPRYNSVSKNAEEYLNLSAPEKRKINSLFQEPRAQPLLRGTYALIAIDSIANTDIDRGECLKVGRTKNLTSRLTDHIQNKRRGACLPYMLLQDFPEVNVSAPNLRSKIGVAFTTGDKYYEEEWDKVLNPRYSEF